MRYGACRATWNCRSWLDEFRRRGDGGRSAAVSLMMGRLGVGVVRGAMSLVRVVKVVLRRKVMRRRYIVAVVMRMMEAELV